MSVPHLLLILFFARAFFMRRRRCLRSVYFAPAIFSACGDWWGYGEGGAERQIAFSGGPVGARFGAQLAGVGAQKAPSRHKNMGCQKRKRS